MSLLWPRVVTALSIGCFAVSLAAFLTVDLNGRFLGMGEMLSAYCVLSAAAIGCAANCVRVYSQRQHRVSSAVMGLFCSYCAVDIGRYVFQ